MQFGIGQGVKRKEDPRLLTGHGRFVDDLAPDDLAHAYFVRSPYAHARLGPIETAAAKAMPGVLAVYTAADVAGLDGIPYEFMPEKDGKPLGFAHPLPLLAADRVRYVGDSVAMVVAETAALARSAGEAITVDYEPLPAVVDTPDAVAEGAPQLFDDIENNVCFTYEAGDPAAVEAALDRAAHITRLPLINNRVVLAALETRGAVAYHDAADGRSTLHTTTQMPHAIRRDLAHVFGEPEDRFRIMVGDVGGGFGGKNSLYPEQPMVVWAARELDRPVKWIGERTDAFQTDFHGRDNLSVAELALDAEGHFQALRVDTFVNLGGHMSGHGAVSPIFNLPTLAGAYTTPHIAVRTRGVFTNTVPTDVYRGAGRPEATYIVERIVDLAAAEMGIDRIELRRRNIVQPSRFPYQTPLGLVYDSGEFERNLDGGMAQADWAGAADRKAAAKARGRLRGIGLCNYVERVGGFGMTEGAEIRIEADGGATLLMGAQANGQGHETAFSQVAVELLGIAFDKVRVIEGDTDAVASGIGSGGSWSILLGGAALNLAADKIIDKAKRIAGHVLEAAVADISFGNGRFAIAGTDRTLGWTEVAAAAHAPEALPDDIEPGLDERGVFTPDNYTYPNGCHVCEVEVDPETGAFEVLAYNIVHDFGRVLNPMLLAGQVHGGVAQGLGQAGFERTVFDSEGQLLSGSFMDYCLPRADDLPDFAITITPTPAPSNPLGFKGCGEAGCAGGAPALINAIVDALSVYGIRHIDMPVTPERIWRAIQHAREGAHDG